MARYMQAYIVPLRSLGYSEASLLRVGSGRYSEIIRQNKRLLSDFATGKVTGWEAAKLDNHGMPLPPSWADGASRTRSDGIVVGSHGNIATDTRFKSQADRLAAKRAESAKLVKRHAASAKVNADKQAKTAITKAVNEYMKASDEYKSVIRRKDSTPEERRNAYKKRQEAKARYEAKLESIGGSIDKKTGGIKRRIVGKDENGKPKYVSEGISGKKTAETYAKKQLEKRRKASKAAKEAEAKAVANRKAYKEAARKNREAEINAKMAEYASSRDYVSETIKEVRAKRIKDFENGKIATRLEAESVSMAEVAKIVAKKKAEDRRKAAIEVAREKNLNEARTKLGAAQKNSLSVAAVDRAKASEEYISVMRRKGSTVDQKRAAYEALQKADAKYKAQLDAASSVVGKAAAAEFAKRRVAKHKEVEKLAKEQAKTDSAKRRRAAADAARKAREALADAEKKKRAAKKEAKDIERAKRNAAEATIRYRKSMQRKKEHLARMKALNEQHERGEAIRKRAAERRRIAAIERVGIDARIAARKASWAAKRKKKEDIRDILKEYKDKRPGRTSVGRKHLNKKLKKELRKAGATRSEARSLSERFRKKQNISDKKLAKVKAEKARAVYEKKSSAAESDARAKAKAADAARRAQAESDYKAYRKRAIKMDGFRKGRKNAEAFRERLEAANRSKYEEELSRGLAKARESTAKMKSRAEMLEAIAKKRTSAGVRKAQEKANARSLKSDVSAARLANAERVLKKYRNEGRSDSAIKRHLNNRRLKKDLRHVGVSKKAGRRLVRQYKHDVNMSARRLAEQRYERATRKAERTASRAESNYSAAKFAAQTADSERRAKAAKAYDDYRRSAIRKYGFRKGKKSAKKFLANLEAKNEARLKHDLASARAEYNKLVAQGQRSSKNAEVLKALASKRTRRGREKLKRKMSISNLRASYQDRGMSARAAKKAAKRYARNQGKAMRKIARREAIRGGSNAGRARVVLGSALIAVGSAARSPFTGAKAVGGALNRRRARKAAARRRRKESAKTPYKRASEARKAGNGAKPRRRNSSWTRRHKR